MQAKDEQFLQSNSSFEFMILKCTKRAKFAIQVIFARFRIKWELQLHLGSEFCRGKAEVIIKVYLHG